MFISNVRELMNKKKKTIREVAAETNMSVSTVHRATQDDTIGGCQLNTLAKIADALGVKTKRLYEEVEECKKLLTLYGKILIGIFCLTNNL